MLQLQLCVMSHAGKNHTSKQNSWPSGIASQESLMAQKADRLPLPQHMRSLHNSHHHHYMFQCSSTVSGGELHCSSRMESRTHHLNLIYFKKYS